MRILMMHLGDKGQGGVQVQMLRLRSGLQRHGIEARILCREKTLDDSVLMPRRPCLERWLGRFTRRLGLNDIHLLSSFDVCKTSDFKDADLIDVHCMHSGAFSYLAFPSLTSNMPAVFTFHDMWPMTGHCHASLECERWKTGCGKCPHPEIHPEIRRDATALEWKLKQWAFRKSKFTIVTPSRWLQDRVRESMHGRLSTHHIPHGIDTDVFRPIEKELCRSLLGIPRGKRVLICASESMHRPLKGADLLVQSLRALPQALQRETVLLLFGQSSPEILKQIHMPVINLGYLHNDHLKALAYSAADVFINPTRAESFGLVVLESMACGTPVVAFAVGGVPELVRPGATGLLAPPFRPEALSEGCCELLGDQGSLEDMARRCRNIAVAEYPLELQVQRYIGIYQNVSRGGGPLPA